MTTPPISIANGIAYGGDFRIGSPSTAPTVIFQGDSRIYNIKGDGVHQIQDYITLPTYLGQTINKINRAWPSNSVYAMLNDNSAVGAANQVNNALAYNAPLNIEVFGPATLNDMGQLGRTYAQMQSDTKAYCNKRRAMGIKMVYCPEVSAVTIGAAGNGDDLKNVMWGWSMAGGAGNEYWRTFADAFIPVANYPPFGQNGGVNAGYNYSAYYNVDGCHWTEAGTQALAAIFQPVLVNFINSLAAANYQKPPLPSFLDLVERVKRLEAL